MWSALGGTQHAGANVDSDSRLDTPTLGGEGASSSSLASDKKYVTEYPHGDHGDDHRGQDRGSSHSVKRSSMKALVYAGAAKKAFEDRPNPEIASPTDAIVRVTKTTICGTDLHILKGDLQSCKPGRILGHEGVGVVEKVGPGVAAFKPGDAVLISCITACGTCSYCRRLMYSHCTTGGWILGNTIDGTQAEFVRIPHADMSLYPVASDADQEALVMLSDILPTGFECGVLNGKVAPGNTVAIVGAGPIGLAALLTAQFYSPAAIIMIDLDDHRLEVAKRFGATACISNAEGKAAEAVMRLTENRGVDTVIEAGGTPATFELCEQLVAPGGTLANIGVHGTKVTLHMEALWDRNITITTRLVDAVSTPMLLKTLKSHKIDPKLLITHRFKMDKILDAYETFAHADKTRALKVLIEA
jgi:alcohol dehydrogenase